jgi:integrase
MATDERNTLTPGLIEEARERAKGGGSAVELSDGTGLRVRATPLGGVAFRWAVRHDGKQKVITLPVSWPDRGRDRPRALADAHAALADLKAAHGAGKLGEALAKLKPPKTEPKADGLLTVRSAAADFLAYLDRERRRPEQARRMFDVEILPIIGGRPIANIRKKDLRGIVEGIVKRGSPVMAGHVRAVLKQFFEWAVDREDDLAMPGFPKLKTLGAKKADRSQRYLTPDEIAAFWRALDSAKGITPTVRSGLRLLLLLGVRSGELLQAEWSQVDFDAATLTIPVAHQKLTKDRMRRAKPWIVPLPPGALEILRGLKGLADGIGSRYVLASFHLRKGADAPGAPLTEKALNHAMRSLSAGREPAVRFEGERPTPHDLRRTLRTHIEESLGVPEVVAERMLNHTRPDIIDIYARGDFLKQRREALEAWDTYVARLVAGEGATVVPMPGKAVRS